MEFKEILKDLRFEYSLSQKEVAEGCNLSPQCISQLEMGLRSPTGFTLMALADFFECSIDYLMGRVTDYENTISGSDNLSTDEKKILTVLRKKPPLNAMEWMDMYAELPTYMQENIFSELKGMYLGYTAVKNRKKLKEN